jgi:hypothetical protein
MTYRDRREARADRLDEWAGKREAKAEAAEASARQLADQIPFGQPILVGHHSEGHARRDADRIYNRTAKAYEHSAKADEMARKAANVRAAADRSIYSDDEDAIERLEERIAELEAERDKIKAYNASCRKGTPDTSLLSDKGRADLESIAKHAPYQLKKNGAMPAYATSNINGNITRNRNRLDKLRGISTTPEKKDCPHCGSSDTRWFRRRFECWGCGKTFSNNPSL